MKIGFDDFFPNHETEPANRVKTLKVDVSFGAWPVPPDGFS